MHGTRATLVVLALVALCALPGPARALPTGTADYALVGTPPATDGAGAWTVEALAIRVDFNLNTVALAGEFRVTPDAGGSGFTFTDADVFFASLNATTGTLSMFAFQNGLGGFSIQGAFDGANGERLLVDFEVNAEFSSLMVVPDPGPILLEADIVPGEATDDVLAQLNAGPPAAPLREGDAINAATGNLYRTALDVPAAGPTGLGFTRHYNSNSPLAGEHGWLHEYAGRIDFDPPGFDQGLLLVRPNGRGLLFHRTDTGALATGPAEIPADVPAVGTDQFPLHWTGGEWRFRNADGGHEFYDGQGRLLRIVGRDGFTRTLERDAAGRIATVRDDFGRRLDFAYDPDGRLVALTDPAGQRWQYAYDAEGRLAGVTDPLGHRRTYHYAESDAPTNGLSGITDERGTRFASWSYDSDNRVTRGERAGGVEWVELDYGPGDVTVATFAGGGTRRYTFTSAQGRSLAAAIDGDLCNGCGKAAAWAYNDVGLPTRITDPRGTITELAYDAHGLETRRTEAVGTAVARTVTTTWDTELRRPLTIDRPLSRIEFEYDARGRLLARSETDTLTFESRTTTRRYHPDGTVPGQLASIDGPRTDVDDVTTFAYDSLGNRIRSTNALGQVTKFGAHDEFGRALQVTDPNGLVTAFRYDERGRLVSRDVGGEETTFAYDEVGNRVQTTRADGSFVRHVYDEAHRLQEAVDEEGNRIEYEFDSAGNRIAERVFDRFGVLARITQRTFDPLARMTSITRFVNPGELPATTAFEYDANGNRTAIVDPAPGLNRTERKFDALDRLVAVTDVSTGNATSFEYDQQGRVTRFTSPRGNMSGTGNFTTIGYNGFGDRTEVVSPDSGKTVFQYDAAGNVVARIDAEGQRAEHAYDALNRRTRSQYPDGVLVEYVYDEGDNAIGRLARIEEDRRAKRKGHDRHGYEWRNNDDRGKHRSQFVGHGSGSGRTLVEWSYDRHGRVIERRQRVDGKSLTTRHAYDAAGRHVETVYPSGLDVAFTYKTDAVTGIQADGEAVIRDVSYQPFGPVSGWTWGDGDDHARSYDLDGHLIRQTLADGARELRYTPNGNVASITGPRLQRTYDYDALGRLTMAADPALLDRYEYDANGNRTSRALDGKFETYTIDPVSNRLLGVDGARPQAFTYDATGNMVDDGEHRYLYSARGDLIAVDDGRTAAYRYNALGQRIFKRARREIDFPALAEQAELQAEALASEAAGLRDRAHEAKGEAAEARRRVAKARSDRKRAEKDLERAEAEAGSHRRVGGIWQQIFERFAERAAHLRARIVEPARSGWQRWRNQTYGWLASLFARLAERWADLAEARLALAEAAEERAAAALVALAEAETRLARAEAEAATAHQRAQGLREAARDTRKQVKEQRRRAAEFRRLAEKGDARRLQVRFAYDEAGRLLGRYFRSGKAIREYIRLGGVPVATVSRDGVHYVHADHLGTPRLVSEPDGPVIWSWISAPFGDGAADEDADGNGTRFTFNLRFPAQYFDAETGRHHATARDYAPRLGRNVAPAAGRAAGVANAYVHAANNPLRFTGAGPAPSVLAPDCASVTGVVAIRGACP